MSRKLKDKDLFVVQFQPQDNVGEPDSILARKDEILSVTFKTVKDSAVHKAYPGTDSPSGDLADSAGLVYPGNGFYYDENTGRMDVKVDSDLTFVRVIESDSVPGTSTTDWTNDTPVARGNFYIVGAPDMTLDTIWAVEPGQETPDLGDLVVCIDDSVVGETGYRTHKWNVIPNVTGGQAVLQITSAVPGPGAMLGSSPVEVSTSSPNSSQRPRIRIREAGQSLTSGQYVGGLISSLDMQKLGETPTDLINDGFIFDLELDGQKVTTDALHMDTVPATKAPNSPQFKGVILEITPANDSVYGVVELANQHEIDDQISGPGTMPSSLKSAMTPRRTIENFVPRLFNTLQSLDSIN